jgi:hypothetical protein
MESHDLLHEFPEHRDKIIALQKGSNRFRKLQEEYNIADSQIRRIETGAEATTDEHLNELRMKRVHLKDSLYHFLA